MQPAPYDKVAYTRDLEVMSHAQQIFRPERAQLRYETYPPAKTTFHEFLWSYVGDPNKSEDLAADPEIINGNFAQKVECVYTEGGTFILIRKRPGPTRQLYDYYAVKCNLADQSFQRLYVAGHTFTLSPNGSIQSERYILSKDYDYRVEHEPEPPRSGDALRDMLDYKDIVAMHREQVEGLPQVVLLGTQGDSSYFSEGGRRELIMGGLDTFFYKLQLLQTCIKNMGVAAVSNTVKSGADAPGGVLEPVRVNARILRT